MIRQRWQHDQVNSVSAPDSACINEEQFRKSAEDGKLRKDPNGNLITSRVGPSDNDDKADQMPIIDLDIPHVYVPSRTEGHGHLYINKTLHFDAYREIIEVLAKHNIVGQGNLLQLDVYRHSAARLPRDFEDRRPYYDRNL